LGPPDTPFLKKCWLHIFYLLLLATTAAGQGARQYTFNHFGVSSGLASNEATDGLQDERGFIWVGTNNGLQRFDGQRYLSFHHEKGNPSSIPHNFIVQLLLDKKKNLWILTGNGKIGTFDTKRFIFHEVKVKVNDTSMLAYDKELIGDEQGNLFILFQNNDFITWNEQQQEFAAIHNFIRLPADWKFTDILQQP